MASLSLHFNPFLSVPTRRPHPHANFFLPLRAEAGKVKMEPSALDSSTFLRRPLGAPPSQMEREPEAVEIKEREEEAAREQEERESPGRPQEWSDWEEMILEDTVPLVGFVRMILHSGKYQNGDKLSPEHETAILTKLLPHHPEYEKKIGCGVKAIKMGLHPQFYKSRCLFIERKDDEVVDFSYWKCIKGLIRKRYPLYADTFIERHFRKKRG